MLCMSLLLATAFTVWCLVTSVMREREREKASHQILTPYRYRADLITANGSKYANSWVFKAKFQCRINSHKILVQLEIVCYSEVIEASCDYRRLVAGLAQLCGIIN